MPKWAGQKVYLRVQHDFWRSVPPRGDVLCETTCVIVFWISDSCEAEIANSEVTVRVDQHIGWLEVPAIEKSDLV